MKKNSGVFIFKDGLFLILHRTGQDSITWTLPVGTIKDNLNGQMVVMKKLQELCGIERKRYGELRYLGEEICSFGNLMIEAYQTSLLPSLKKLQLGCSYIVDDGISEGKLSIDEYKWVDRDIASRLLPEYQAKFLERM